MLASTKKTATTRVQRECYRRHMMLTQKGAQSRAAKVPLHIYKSGGTRQLKAVRKWLGVKKLHPEKIFEERKLWPQFRLPEIERGVLIIHILPLLEGEKVPHARRIQAYFVR